MELANSGSTRRMDVHVSDVRKEETTDLYGAFPADMPYFQYGAMSFTDPGTWENCQWMMFCLILYISKSSRRCDNHCRLLSNQCRICRPQCQCFVMLSWTFGRWLWSAMFAPTRCLCLCFSRVQSGGQSGWLGEFGLCSLRPVHPPDGAALWRWQGVYDGRVLW